VPAKVESTFLKRYLLLAYQQFVVDSASCRNHINMGAEGRGKSLVNFRQVACSLGLFVVLFYYCLVCIFTSCFRWCHRLILLGLADRKKRSYSIQNQPRPAFSVLLKCNSPLPSRRMIQDFNS